MNDANNIKWHWVGQGERCDGGTLYSTARVDILSDKTERIFKVGDSVYVDNEEEGGPPWVAQIVEFYQPVKPVPGVDPNSNRNKFVTLRWMYNPADVDTNCIRGVRFPIPLPDELYFSDHVESRGTNGIEVIEGRAFLVDHSAEVERFRGSPSDRYWDTDKVILVRHIYNNRSTPGGLRELDKGELKKLIDNPTVNPVYSRKNRAFGGFQAVLKGTRRPSKTSLPKPLQESESSSDGIPRSFGTPRLGKQGGTTRAISRDEVSPSQPKAPKSRVHRERDERRMQKAKEVAKYREDVVMFDKKEDSDDDAFPEKVTTPTRRRTQVIEASGRQAAGSLRRREAIEASGQAPGPSRRREVVAASERATTPFIRKEIIEASGQAPGSSRRREVVEASGRATGSSKGKVVVQASVGQSTGSSRTREVDGKVTSPGQSGRKRQVQDGIEASGGALANLLRRKETLKSSAKKIRRVGVEASGTAGGPTGRIPTKRKARHVQTAVRNVEQKTSASDSPGRQRQTDANAIEIMNVDIGRPVAFQPEHEGAVVIDPFDSELDDRMKKLSAHELDHLLGVESEQRANEEATLELPQIPLDDILGDDGTEVTQAPSEMVVDVNNSGRLVSKEEKMANLQKAINALTPELRVLMASHLEAHVQSIIRNIRHFEPGTDKLARIVFNEVGPRGTGISDSYND